MTGKDDPLQQHGSVGGRTLWLRGDNMEQARDNFWKVYRETVDDHSTHGEGQDRRTWDIAWAAAIAAFSYVMEGRVEAR